MERAYRQIVVIGNPVAGGGALEKVRRAVRLLNDRGCDVELLLTEKRGDAVSFARRAAARHSRDNPLLVIAAGGDGTYNEVANGLVFSEAPMAILPLGTTSVLAYELSIPHNLESALDIALTGTPVSVHLGRITLPGRSASRYFLLMAGAGFDGEVVMRVNEKLKKLSGRGAYILSGLKVLLGYRPAPITVRNRDRSLLGYTAIVGKAACYGGKLQIAKDARLTDPHLYVFVTHKRGRLSLIRYVLGILRGVHLGFKDTAYFKTDRVEIDGTTPIQVDGDYVGHAPATIEIAADALRLVMKNSLNKSP